MSSITPNMTLTIPTVGNAAVPDGGPGYATEINAAFNLIDAHDHSSGKGVPVTQNGINITGALPFQTNPATGLTYIALTNQAAALSTTRSLYNVNGELYWTDGSGNQVKLTAAGAVNTGGSGNLSGMDATSAVTYSTITKVFTFTQSSAFPAKIATGDIEIFETVAAAAQTITIKAPTGLANTFSITLPGAVPATNALAQFSTAAVMSFVAAPASTGLLQSTSAGALSYVVTGGTLPTNLTLVGATLTTVNAASTDSDSNQLRGIPPGVQVPFAGFTAPTGWLLCDGTAVSRTTYATLFAVVSISTTGDTHTTTTVDNITSTTGMDVGMPVAGTNIQAGTTVSAVGAHSITLSLAATGSTAGGVVVVCPYGVGDQVGATGTTFNVPDKRGKVSVGAGTGSGLTKRVLGVGGGEEAHALSIGELAAHTHPELANAGTAVFQNGVGGNQNALVASSAPANGIAQSTGSNGSGTAHNTMQPFQADNWIIKT